MQRTLSWSLLLSGSIITLEDSTGVSWTSLNKEFLDDSLGSMRWSFLKLHRHMISTWDFLVMVRGYYWPIRYLRHCSYVILFMNPGINFTNCKYIYNYKANYRLSVISNNSIKRTHLFDVIRGSRDIIYKQINQ